MWIFVYLFVLLFFILKTKGQLLTQEPGTRHQALGSRIVYIQMFGPYSLGGEQGCLPYLQPFTFSQSPASNASPASPDPAWVTLGYPGHHKDQENTDMVGAIADTLVFSGV